MTLAEAPPALPPTDPGTPADPETPAHWWSRGTPARRYAPVGALLLVVVAVALITVGDAPTGLPLDPSSTEADGTKALVLILEELGADVAVLDTTDDLDVDTLVVLYDNLSESSVAAVEEFAEDGGTVLVADANGLLTFDQRLARPQTLGLLEPALVRGCDVPALAGVERVRIGGAPMFVVPDDAVGCFQRDEAAWLLITERGSGMVVMTGGPTFLTNGTIGALDNAALAAAVLAPRPGTRVGVLRPSWTFAADGEEQKSLSDLIPPRVSAAVWQLLFAFGVVVLWRMRRLGKPVAEPQSVRLPGSELVVATGNLLQRTGARKRAAELLRNDFRRTVAHRLGLPPELPSEDLAQLTALRTGADRTEIFNALTETVPDTDAELVALAQRLEVLREALSPHVPAGATRDPRN